MSKLQCCFYEDVNPLECPNITIFAHEQRGFATSYVKKKDGEFNSIHLLKSKNNLYFFIHNLCPQNKQLDKCCDDGCNASVHRLMVWQLPRCCFILDEECDEKKEQDIKHDPDSNLQQEQRYKKAIFDKEIESTVQCTGCNEVFHLKYKISESEYSWQEWSYDIEIQK